MNVEKNIDEKGHGIITIDGLMHLKFLAKINAVHSYIDETSRTTLEGLITYNMYYINFHLDSGQTVKCEYNRRDLWEQILKGL